MSTSNSTNRDKINSFKEFLVESLPSIYHLMINKYNITTNTRAIIALHETFNDIDYIISNEYIGWCVDMFERLHDTDPITTNQSIVDDFLLRFDDSSFDDVFTELIEKYKHTYLVISEYDVIYRLFINYIANGNNICKLLLRYLVKNPMQYIEKKKDLDINIFIKCTESVMTEYEKFNVIIVAILSKVSRSDQITDITKVIKNNINLLHDNNSILR